MAKKAKNPITDKAPKIHTKMTNTIKRCIITKNEKDYDQISPLLAALLLLILFIYTDTGLHWLGSNIFVNWTSNCNEEDFCTSLDVIDLKRKEGNWKSPKKLYLNFGAKMAQMTWHALFENNSKCRIWILAFFTNFCLI